MAKQNVDFAQSGPTLDTGERDSTAIRPINNAEGATETVFRRPSENLRTRTETLKDEVAALKYIADADRVLVALGGGDLTWQGIVSGGGTGKLVTTADLFIRPFISPTTATRAKATIRGVLFQTILTQVGLIVPPRAYSGANDISVQLQGSDGATLAVAVSGTPADNVVITLNTNASTGTTKQQLVDFLNLDSAALVYRNLGLTAALDVGAVGTDKVAPGGGFISTDFQVLSGAVDAEAHLITAAGLASFFTDSSNLMQNGDVLCIWYDKLVNGAGGGRRESTADLPENSANADANLFLLRRFPERLPLAIPVARVDSDLLRMVDGTIFLKNSTGSLSGGLGYPPSVSQPPARFLKMPVSGAPTWGVITSDMIQSILAIASFAATAPTVEVGATVTTPPFTASYTQGPPTAATLTKDLLGSPQVQTLTPPATSFSAAAPPTNFQKLNTNEFVRFKLIADAGNTPAEATTDISWRRYFYYGKSASASPTLDESFIRVAAAGPNPGLDAAPGGKTLTSGRGNTFSMTGLANEYVYVAFADSHGALVGLRDNVAGFDIDFVDMGTVAAVSTENGAGTTTTFHVYRSLQALTGSINFTTR
jgi:hypothetical protein